ncbi:hypothetical protein OKA04_01775 [Luteolibacter flavescens]|uniref:CN hydrolase domain-containing protein n=1 Tax=Luteolibacter flavescens TaxID=1859460 RepID=A0ABT3FIP6_9BACT|nr:nitrilase-related carbon-nitrogen hydrolase [Luteolibacter flavescens]MCW1883438.1 hypothetical protein [Luteolibacter flavescens]
MELSPATRFSFYHRLLLAVVSGGLYALAYPPLGWRWLVVPGLVGLLVALHDQKGSRARVLGLLHGMMVFAVGLSWLYQLFSLYAIVLWIILAVFTAAFAHFQGLATARGLKGWHLAVFTAFNWGGWEFIRSELFPLKFPWFSAGLSIGPNALLPWIGVYGVGVIVILAAALLSRKHWKGAASVFALLLAACLLPSRHQTPGAEDPAAVKVGGVQLENVTIHDFIPATESLPGDVRFVAWPEYALPYDVQAYPPDWKLLQQFCRDRDITLTLGTQRREPDGVTWRNIALTLDPDGPRGEHTKAHPVHFFDDGIAGKSAMPIDTRHGKVGTPVCFDCDYEGVTRRMTAAGAEMFVVPVMDAKAWTARQHDQHAELMRIRACENGRWMFICATSGVSQVIDPHGHIHGRLGAMEEGTLTGTLRRESGLTFYTRLGWLTPWIVLGIAAVSWISLIWTKRRGKVAETAPA